MITSSEQPTKIAPRKLSLPAPPPTMGFPNGLSQKNPNPSNKIAIPTQSQPEPHFDLGFPAGPHLLQLYLTSQDYRN